jgi:predicted SAM-dependent methyltransferase
MRKVRDVGGNSKDIPLPANYQGWENVLLDIDPRGKPDVVCDARELTSPEGGVYDAVYCSHDLEHRFRHDVPKVLAGFRHVPEDEGFARIRVPDPGEVMRQAVQKSLAHMLGGSGFPFVYSMTGNLEVMAIAFKHKPNEFARAMSGLPAPEVATAS